MVCEDPNGDTSFRSKPEPSAKYLATVPNGPSIYLVTFFLYWAEIFEMQGGVVCSILLILLRWSKQEDFKASPATIFESRRAS